MVNKDMDKAKRNEYLFSDELTTLDYLIHEYKKEIKRTTKFNDKEFKSTRKNRIKRLRIEINMLLKNIENNLSTDWFCEVE